MSDEAGYACDAAYDVTMAIVEQIRAATATSVAGVIVKSRACSWCHSGEPYDAFSFGGSTEDKRLAATIVRDLLAISGMPTPEGSTSSPSRPHQQPGGTSLGIVEAGQLRP